MIGESEIRQMFPLAGSRLTPHLPFIPLALEKGAINTPLRISAFLAHLAHESAEYRYMEEIADGSEYEGRADLGNTEPGDGMRFKGHGPIQITGRDAHKAVGHYLGIDAVADPRLLTLPQYGTASAVWFWSVYKGPGLNAFADHEWFRLTTKWVNGGYNGLSERLAYYARNRTILGITSTYTMSNEETSIEDFQRSHGLTADGIVGKQTLDKLLH